MAFARADDAGHPNRLGSALAEFVESASSGLGVENRSGLVRQGMGHITAVLAERFTAYGGALRNSAPVRRVLVRQGAAFGIELEDGEQIVTGNSMPCSQPLPGSVPQSRRKARSSNVRLRANYAIYGIHPKAWQDCMDGELPLNPIL